MKEFIDKLQNIEKHPYTWYTEFDWTDKKISYFNDVICVKLGKRYAMYIPSENRYLTDITFDGLARFGLYEHKDLAIVRKDGKMNVLKIDGTLLLDKWCDYVSHEIYGEGLFVAYGDKEYIYNFDGTLRRKVVLPKVCVTIGHGYREGR